MHSMLQIGALLGSSALFCYKDVLKTHG